MTHPPQRVVVVLGIPPGTYYPNIPGVVADAITEHTSREIGVRVEYVHVTGPVVTPAEGGESGGNDSVFDRRSGYQP